MFFEKDSKNYFFPSSFLKNSVNFFKSIQDISQNVDRKKNIAKAAP